MPHAFKTDLVNKSIMHWGWQQCLLKIGIWTVQARVRSRGEGDVHLWHCFKSTSIRLHIAWHVAGTPPQFWTFLMLWGLVFCAVSCVLSVKSLEFSVPSLLKTQSDKARLWSWAWGSQSIVSIVDHSPVISYTSRPGVRSNVKSGRRISC